MTSTTKRILTAGLTMVTATACSEGASSPTEPFPSSAIGAPASGPSANLLELPTDLLSTVTLTLESVQTVKMIPTVALPMGTNTSDHSASGYNSGHHHGKGTTETTTDEGMSPEQRTNECTNEEVIINFKYKTHTTTRTYRDGSTTVTVHDQRKGEGYAIAGFDTVPPFDPIPIVPVVDYFGHEHSLDFTWTRQQDQVQYTDRFLHLDREGNDPRYDDMILHTVVAYWYDDGQLRSRIEYAKLKCH